MSSASQEVTSVTIEAQLGEPFLESLIFCFLLIFSDSFRESGA